MASSKEILYPGLIQAEKPVTEIFKSMIKLKLLGNPKVLNSQVMSGQKIFFVQI